MSARRDKSVISGIDAARQSHAISLLFRRRNAVHALLRHRKGPGNRHLEQAFVLRRRNCRPHLARMPAGRHLPATRVAPDWVGRSDRARCQDCRCPTLLARWQSGWSSSHAASRPVIISTRARLPGPKGQHVASHPERWSGSARPAKAPFRAPRVGKRPASFGRFYQASRSGRRTHERGWSRRQRIRPSRPFPISARLIASTRATCKPVTGGRRESDAGTMCRPSRQRYGIIGAWRTAGEAATARPCELTADRRAA